MMMRVLVLLIIIVSTVIVETTFVSGLAPVIRLVPLSVAFGLTLIQHHGVRAGMWWILAIGLFLDFFRLGPVFPIFPAYLLTAFCADRLAAHLFSNRSYYALLGCGITVMSILFCAIFLIAGLQFLLFHERAAWGNLFSDGVISNVWTAILLNVFFISSGWIRAGLQKVFILQHERQTLT